MPPPPPIPDMKHNPRKKEVTNTDKFSAHYSNHNMDNEAKDMLLSTDDSSSSNSNDYDGELRPMKDPFPLRPVFEPSTAVTDEVATTEEALTELFPGTNTKGKVYLL